MVLRLLPWIAEVFQPHRLPDDDVIPHKHNYYPAVPSIPPNPFSSGGPVSFGVVRGLTWSPVTV